MEILLCVIGAYLLIGILMLPYFSVATILLATYIGNESGLMDNSTFPDVKGNFVYPILTWPKHVMLHYRMVYLLWALVLVKKQKQESAWEMKTGVNETTDTK